MPSVFIKTYGCQMNERDSEAVAAQLAAKGYTLARSAANADVVLLNTCSVRYNAEQKAINQMENLAGNFRKRRPDVVLGYLGCMAQSRGQELIDQLPNVESLFSTGRLTPGTVLVSELPFVAIALLGVGLGSDRNGELGPFGESIDPRERARLLDDGLARLATYWGGEFEPVPVQSPRIPVWVAARWPNRRPLRRAARWDGDVTRW